MIWYLSKLKSWGWKIIVTQILPEGNKSVILKPTTEHPSLDHYATQLTPKCFPFQTLQKGSLLYLSHFSSKLVFLNPLPIGFTETALIKGINDLHVAQSEGQISVLTCPGLPEACDTAHHTRLHPASSIPWPLLCSCRWFPSLHRTGSVPLAIPIPFVLSPSLMALNVICMLRTPNFTSQVWTHPQDSTHISSCLPDTPSWTFGRPIRLKIQSSEWSSS